VNGAAEKIQPIDLGAATATVAESLNRALFDSHQVTLDGDAVLVRPRADGGIVRRVQVYEGHLSSLDPALLAAPDATLFIACRGNPPAPTSWELTILAALFRSGPLLCGDLAPRCELPVRGHAAVREVSALADRVARSAGGPPVSGLLAGDVAHELATKALTECEGAPRNHGMDEGDRCRLSVAVAGGRVLICATDKSGLLPRDPVVKSIARLSRSSRTGTPSGKAGLMLLRSFQHGDLVATRVDPGHKTEVLCALELSPARRRTGGPKSVFLF